MNGLISFSISYELKIIDKDKWSIKYLNTNEELKKRGEDRNIFINTSLGKLKLDVEKWGQTGNKESDFYIIIKYTFTNIKPILEFSQISYKLNYLIKETIKIFFNNSVKIVNISNNNI